MFTVLLPTRRLQVITCCGHTTKPTATSIAKVEPESSIQESVRVSRVRSTANAEAIYWYRVRSALAACLRRNINESPQNLIRSLVVIDTQCHDEKIDLDPHTDIITEQWSLGFAVSSNLMLY